jgi:hypothetical protein
MRQEANLLTIKDLLGIFISKIVGVLVLGMAISTKGFNTFLKTSILGSKGMMWSPNN